MATSQEKTSEDKRNQKPRRQASSRARRQRHRRVAALFIALTVVAVGLIVFGGEKKPSASSQAEALCDTYSDRVIDEHRLSFPEIVVNDDANNTYLSHAFADTMDELVDKLQALDLPAEAQQAVAALGARIAAIRADPAGSNSQVVNPIETELKAFDDLGLDACGSGFFGVVP